MTAPIADGAPGGATPAAPVRPRARWRRIVRWILIRVARTALVIYVVLTIMLMALQDKLMFPASDTQGAARAQVKLREGHELIDLRLPDGTPVKALFASARANRDPSSAVTILFFYGNGCWMADMLSTIEPWRKLGANVVIVEYPGYGLSGGKPGEAPFFAAADAAWDWLQTSGRVDGTKVIAIGWSIGGAVAIDLASRKPVAGLVTMSTFTSMPDIAHRLYPYLPVRWLITHKFDSLKKMDRVTCPTLIMHGRHDTMIPWSMSEQLAAACKGPVQTVFFDNLDHCDSWNGCEDVDDAVKRMIAAVEGAEQINATAISGSQ